ncbi:transposase, partial [Campylobacter coli]|nr:transposase [Campylobacter coli]
VATRKVSNIMETLCGTTFSKSSVSEVCKDLIEKVNEFKDRPLTGDYPFLIVDATYFKVRDKHRIVSKAFMIAYGTNQEGHVKSSDLKYMTTNPKKLGIPFSKN